MNFVANFAAARIMMVKDQLIRRGIRAENVIEMFRTVPREIFVAAADRSRAYDDTPLKIGYGQTISQPYIAALTCQALEIAPRDLVLEIGAGSGYQTAILSGLCRQVISIERVPELLSSAKSRLHDMGLINVRMVLADGTLGLAADAPFDAIAVTAASPKVPDPLIFQLATGGRMVIPVGNRVQQELFLLKKMPDGVIRREKLCDCRFVSLIGQHGFSDPTLNERG